MVQPWFYRGWDRQNDELNKEKLAKVPVEIIEAVPEEMRM